MTDLYSEEILDHCMHPLHEGTLKKKSISISLSNKSCGDRITIELEIEEDRITDGTFSGEACAIARASSDILLEELIGKNIAESLELIESMQKYFACSEDAAKLDPSDDLCALLQVRQRPARLACALLPWNDALKMELETKLNA